ncbi:MAG: Gfo/Idh/MocA family oxidoreductase [Acidobacteriota bacterium]
MSEKMGRRQLLKSSLGIATVSGLLRPQISIGAPKAVRLGLVGVGCRGTDLLETLLDIEGVEIGAIADVDSEHLLRAQNLVESKRGKRPEGYGKGPEDFRRLVKRDDLDAVLTATPWKWHTPVCVAAMKAGKYAATEVPAATTLEECWELVRTSEETGKPCMMLENVCYFRDALMILNMVRAGEFGELIHCEAGYQHDIRDVPNGCSGYFDKKGNLLWRGEEAARHNGNIYPTHQLGPVAQYLNIDRGNRFTVLVSMSSKARGFNDWVKHHVGPDHPNAKKEFALGDVNTSLIKTADGCTVTLYHDTSLPRPYDLIFRVQGTKGLYMKTLDSVYIEGVSPKEHAWETVETYREKFEHPLWKQLGDVALKYGHGGGDYITLHQFVQAVRNRTQTPQDVYDAATWSAISPLSEKSVTGGSVPVEFPDFTKGKWKSRPPVGIVTS